MPDPRTLPDALMHGLSRRERAAVETQGYAAVQSLRAEWKKQRVWIYSLSGVMGLLAILLPAGLMYQYLVDASSLSAPQILGVMMGACLFAALHGGAATYLVMNWHQRNRRLKALAQWIQPASPSSVE